MRPFFLFWGVFLPATITCLAQKPVSDIRPALKSLSPEQKALVVEYLKSTGSGVDDDIQSTYRQTSEPTQSKTVMLIDWLRQQQKQTQLATTTWDKDTIYFADSTEGAFLTGAFLVANTGSIPYLIKAVKTTCDCVVYDVPAHPIMPGESAVIKLGFDTSGKLGIATPALIVYDNSIPNQRKILYARANILARKKPHKYPWND